MSHKKHSIIKKFKRDKTLLKKSETLESIFSIFLWCLSRILDPKIYIVLN
jgi:hypothetical protein